MKCRRGRSAKVRRVIVSAAAAATLAAGQLASAQQNRLLGVDVSDWQNEDGAGNPLAPIDWNLVHASGIDFLFHRSTRGGTTGTYNKHTGTGTLSHRYDDYRFVENITNATAAGIYVGMYHFTRPDILTNTGTDEADHMLEVAGPWMKPGYLLPVDDLEAGAAERSTADLSQWHVDFANRIFQVKGIRPIVYVNQNYALNELDSTVPAAMPNNWVARWPNQTYSQVSIDTQNWNPIPSPITANVYGVWNAAFPAVSSPEPWKFWQYSSRGKNIPGLLGDANGNTDLNVAHGDHEFIRDFLVPALWTTDSSGDWSTVTNWNSHNPDYDPGDLSKGPISRLPGQIAMTNGTWDTVILDRGAANPTITLSSGSHNIRKLIVKEQFNITGGSLNVNYVPTQPKGGNIGGGPVSAQFSNDASITAGSFSAHTILVDDPVTLSVGSAATATLTFNTLTLEGGLSTSGTLLITGSNININPLNGATAKIVSTGGFSGRIDLQSNFRQINVGDGAAEHDLVVNVPLVNGGLIKGGPGTMVLGGNNLLTGTPTVVSAGTLIASAQTHTGSVNNDASLIYDQSTAGTYGGNIAGGGTFIKRGLAELTMTGISATTGVVNVDAGTLRLLGAGTLAAASGYNVSGATLIVDNNSTNTNNRLSGGAITLKSGVIQFAGLSTNESAGALVAAAGANHVTMAGSGSSNLGFTALTRAAGATLNFSGGGAGANASFGTFTPNAFVDQGTFVNGNDYAVWDATGKPAAMVTGGGANEYSTTVTPGRHVKLTSPANVNATMSINTLNLSGATSLNLDAGNVLFLTNGGIIKSAGGAGSITGGANATLSIGSPTTEYVVNTAGATDQLTISLPIFGGAGLTKTGIGTLTLTGAAQYGGPTSINAGVLVAGPTNLNAEQFVLSGHGTLRTSAPFSTGRNVVLAGTAGTIDTNALDSHFYGDFTGAGGLTKTGGGTLTVNGPASTQSGYTAITGGTLAAGSTNLGSGSVTNYLYFNSGTLKTIGAISTDRNITLEAGGGTFDANGYASTFGGVISGTGALGLTNSGSVQLTGTNTYTGATNIAVGTLIASSANLGNASGQTNFTNGGRLRLSGDLAGNRGFTFNTGGGVIDTDGYAMTLNFGLSGTGPFTKSGFGVMTVKGAGTHSSAVTVNNGTLAYAGSTGTHTSATSYTVNAGGILKLDNSTIAGGNNNNRLADSAPITLNSGTIWLYGNPTTETAGNLTAASGANTIVVTGSGTSTLALGTYSRTAGASLNWINGSSTLKTTFTGGVTPGNFIDQGSFVGGNYAVYDAAGHVRAMASGAGDSDFATTMTAARHVKLGANTTGVATTSIYTLNLTNVNLGLAGGATLTLSKGGILKTGTTENTISGGSAITTGVGTEMVVNVVAADDLLTVSTPMTGSSGLTKTGLGRLTLSGSNSYGGTTTIAGGTLRVSGSSIPNTSLVFIASDAQLDINGITETIGNLTMQDGRIISGVTNNSGTVALGAISPTVTYSGTSKGAVISALNLSLGTGAGTATFNISDGDAAADMTINANLLDGTGSHALTKSGSGTLVLRGSNNSFTGNVTVNGGTLNVDGVLTSSSGFVTVNAGTLGGSGTINKHTTLNGGGVLDFSGGTIFNNLSVNGGTWKGTGTVAGTTTQLSGAFIIGAGANLIGNNTVNIQAGTIEAAHASSTITASVNYTSNSSSLWIGNIAGSGKSLTLNNTAAVLTLGGVNTYIGQTNVNGGILRLTRSDNLTNTSLVSQSMSGSTGGTVQLTNNISVNRPLRIGGAGLNGGSVTPPGSMGALDNLSGVNTWAGTITLNGTSDIGGNALLNQIGATAGTLVLSGVVQNGAGQSLGKTGHGDVVLTGASPNTYSNQTLVFGGRLIIEKNQALGGAGSDANSTGNTFMLAGSNSTIAFRAPGASPGFDYSANEWINLDGFGNGVLGQLDNLGGDNTFAGKIGFGSTSATLGVSAGSLHIEGGLYTRGGSASRTINKSGSGRLILSGDSGPAPSNSVNGSLVNSTFNVNSGTVELRSPSATTSNLPGVTNWDIYGALELSSGYMGSDLLNVQSGGQVKITNGFNTIRTATLNILSGGDVDLGKGKVIVNYSGSTPIGSWDGVAYTGLIGHVQAGRGDGSWNGLGIRTSQSDATTSVLTTVAIAEASEVLGLGAGETTTWRGQLVDADSVLVAYTWGGDADMNGELNGDDYFYIDSNVINSGSVFGFNKGDFDYNGVIDGDDYFIIDSNITFAQSSPPFDSAGGVGGMGGLATVPEPASLGIITTAVGLLLKRRRRRL